MVKIKQHKKTTFDPMPPFKTYQEEANFWDTHSAVDQIDDGTIVGFHRSNKTGTLTIRFDPADLQQVREKAFQSGIGPTTLVRMWVKEKLNLSQSYSQSVSSSG